MAILHHKEEKIQVVLGRLPNKYTHEQFVEMFIKLYSKDWGKIKSAFNKQNQDKEPGTVINMPKPDLYLKQLLETYVAANPAKAEVMEVEATPPVKPKAAPKKKAIVIEEAIVEEVPVVKAKAAPKKKVEKNVENEEVADQKKTVAKKKVAKEKVEEVKEPKKKAAAKKTVETEEVAPTKAKKVKVEKK
ncbi:hypothetical protein [Pedobacter cryotolerans]|uniref:hypothetical protein n=1 Tax=Pedobacter cryotolerans TaxID=2571270 RepID=UPI001980DC43|nr:hypothetical protein [Pedobacter cryotolerans]